MPKLNIVKHFKVEINGVYFIKLTHEPTREVVEELKAQFDGLSNVYNAKFVLLGNQMDILNGTDELKEALKRYLQL